MEIKERKTKESEGQVTDVKFVKCMQERKKLKGTKTAAKHSSTLLTAR